MSVKKVDVKKMREDLMKTNPTLYCSCMAFLRGKQHMTKLHMSTLSDMGIWWDYDKSKKQIADERRQMYYWTKEDQAEYVMKTLAQYMKEE